MRRLAHVIAVVEMLFSHRQTTIDMRQMFTNQIRSEERDMTKTELLEESILKITKQAGLEMSGRFHLTSVSQDSMGLFIMDVMGPERKRLCEEVQRVVTGFPSDTESSFFALLPEVVDEIIFAAQSDPTDFLQSRNGETFSATPD